MISEEMKAEGTLSTDAVFVTSGSQRIGNITRQVRPEEVGPFWET